MSKILDQLSDLGLEISMETVEALNNIAQMETTDFNAALKSIENMAGRALDNDAIINLKKHAMQFQQTISKDGNFVETLNDSSEVMGILGDVKDVLDNAGTAVDMFDNMGGMLNILHNNDLSEQQKIDQFEAKFESLKENGADAVMTVFDSTFGTIPGASNLVEDKLRNFVTSENGLEKISNQIGDFFDSSIDNIATKTGLKDYLIEQFTPRFGDEVLINNLSSEDKSIEELIAEKKQQLGMDQGVEPGFELPDELPPTGADVEVSDAEVQNIAEELSSNVDLLYQNMERFTSSIGGI